MKNWVLLCLVIVVSLLLEKGSSLQCYSTCFGDGCTSGSGTSCEKRCGSKISQVPDPDSGVGSITVELPSYIAVNCSAAPGDQCLMLEFLSFTNDSAHPQYFISTPIGCLSTFLASTFANSRFGGIWDWTFSASNFKAYSCEGDFCNTQSGLSTCNATAATILAADSKEADAAGFPCKNSVFDTMLSNSIRGGDQGSNMTRRCILDDYVELDKESDCIITGSNCASNLPSEEIGQMNCTEMLLLTGTLNAATPAPSFSTEAPASTLANIGTLSPTFSPNLPDGSGAKVVIAVAASFSSVIILLVLVFAWYRSSRTVLQEKNILQPLPGSVTFVFDDDRINTVVDGIEVKDGQVNHEQVREGVLLSNTDDNTITEVEKLEIVEPSDRNLAERYGKVHRGESSFLASIGDFSL